MLLADCDIGIAHVVCGAWSMKSHGVHPSVHPSIRAWATAANFAAVAWPAGYVGRLLHSTQQVNAGTATLLTYTVAEHRLVDDVSVPC